MSPMERVSFGTDTYLINALFNDPNIPAGYSSFRGRVMEAAANYYVSTSFTPGEFVKVIDDYRSLYPERTFAEVITLFMGFGSGEYVDTIDEWCPFIKEGISEWEANLLWHSCLEIIKTSEFYNYTIRVALSYYLDALGV